MRAGSGFICENCRRHVKTPFRMKIPSFSELEKAEKTNSRSKKLIFIFALISVLIPIAFVIMRYLMKLSITNRRCVATLMYKNVTYDKSVTLKGFIF